MTHEFKDLLQGYQNAEHIGLKTVTATVVALDGSSYRRPGVRMLINEQGQMTGAVSGGCVEKEIIKQANSVFKTGVPKMITYDGRYKLGCEGVLYILIEVFDPETEMINAFEKCLKQRNFFDIKIYYSKKTGMDRSWGSIIEFDDEKHFSFAKQSKKQNSRTIESNIFIQKMKPCFKLIIIGAEHDAAQLCLLASSLGWDTVIVASPSSSLTLADFPGAIDLILESPETIEFKGINKQTGVVLMTHSYAKDFRYLLALKQAKPAYIGLLGPSNRREKILNELIEHDSLIDESLFDIIYGPTGLNIGAVTPKEIALSICAEILSVIRKEEPKSLKNKIGRIHLNLPT